MNEQRIYLCFWLHLTEYMLYVTSVEHMFVLNLISGYSVISHRTIKWSLQMSFWWFFIHCSCLQFL